jgi:hypothetical protein
MGCFGDFLLLATNRRRQRMRAEHMEMIAAKISSSTFEIPSLWVDQQRRGINHRLLTIQYSGEYCKGSLEAFLQLL